MMNNIDRILRIIYRESNLSDLIDKIKTYRKVNYYSFDLDNQTLKNAIAMKYSAIYPENYSCEEVLNSLNYYNEKIKKYSNKTYPDFYNLFYLCADSLLSEKHNDLVVNFDNLLEWDGVCNKIDGNIVIAAYIALNCTELNNIFGAVLKHDNNYINYILAGGAADIHMHYKASGYSVEMSWACLMACSIYKEKYLKKFVQDSGMIYEGFCNSVEQGVEIIKKIKIIRLILERFVYADEREQGESFELNDAISLLENWSDSALYKNNNWIISGLDEIEKKYAKGRTNVEYYFKAEREFLTEVFKYLRNQTVAPVFSFLFNIYLCGLCKIRFYFVQDNSGMGFEKFKFRESVKDNWLILKSVNKKNVIRDGDFAKSVFDRCYKAKCVRYAEFRVATKKVSELSKFVKELDAANEDVYKRYQSENVHKIKYGLVVHFIKEKDCPEPTVFSYRWEKFRHDIANEAENLICIIEKKKKFNEKIVGVDAANYEGNCRPEVFSDTFRKLKYKVATQRKLGFTYHVGEAFETLCSGIRAVDEAIEFLNFGDGDRLGHAIALGIDVDLFRKIKRDQINVCVGTYIDDIAWMYFTLQNQAESNHTDLFIFLQTEFDRYKNLAFNGVIDDNNIHIEDYIDSWILRGDAPSLYVEEVRENLLRLSRIDNYKLNKKMVGHDKAINNVFACSLNSIYLKNPRFFKNCRQTLCITPNEKYWTALNCAQRAIHKKVYERKIAIETNPSSNRKISPVSKFIELPFIRFNSFGLTCDNADKREDVPISVNTDDGSIFQSDLANEYALVAACLHREKYPLQEIYRYIDYLRNSSISQTFIDVT